MPQAITSVWKPLKPIVLVMGLATVLTACNVHDSGRRGPVHYSERHHWHDGDRDRGRYTWRRDRDRDHGGWRHDRRRGDRDRHDRRRRSED